MCGNCLAWLLFHFLIIHTPSPRYLWGNFVLKSRHADCIFSPIFHHYFDQSHLSHSRQILSSPSMFVQPYLWFYKYNNKEAQQLCSFYFCWAGLFYCNKVFIRQGVKHNKVLSIALMDVDCWQSDVIPSLHCP